MTSTRYMYIRLERAQGRHPCWLGVSTGCLSSVVLYMYDDFWG